MRFFVLPTVVAAIVHVYLWRRLVRDLALRKWPRAVATLALCALFGSIPLTLFTVLFVARTGNSELAMIGFGWLGLTIYLTAMLVAADLVRWVLRHTRNRSRAPAAQTELQPTAAAEAPTLDSQSRRVFVARAVAGSALLATGGVGVFGVRSAVWEVVTPEVPVALPRLPRQLDGYLIALLTDIHIGPMLGGRFLRQLVDHTNSLKPDLIAIGGDLVDGMVHEIGSQVAELQRLRARDGVYFVTGNHEYYSGSGAWIQFLEGLGINVLQNKHVTVGDASAKGARFDLGGIPDRMGAMWGHGPDVLSATRDRDPERALVMLAHQPIQISDSVRVGAGLQLSGHTHGGQLMPFGAIARLKQPYLSGLHRHPGTDTQIYVSCGAGFWGPPLRVFAPAEITQIRLVAA
ncbi:MAG TPA: metallophosphoesterase [Polyangiales bacterium]|nr:metallophosphoesterase [Polyangiales bacterium]